MNEQLQKLKQDFDAAISNTGDLTELKTVEERFFSRQKGEMTLLMKELGNLTPEERKAAGQRLNEVNRSMKDALQAKRRELEGVAQASIAETEAIDVTQPALSAPTGASGTHPMGHLHPITQIQSDLEDFFSTMGFRVLDGPELESEYYNFEALNIPKEHPARDMQDTFFISAKGGPASGGKDSDRWLMRTHTSPMQVRAMREFGAPIRAIVPGRVFRNEATDARHEHTFYQLEGFVVDRGISFAHLKGILEAVAKYLYGEKTKLRLRPKFYPFVEPGVNGEVTCFLCQGKGCRVCKRSGWLEIFGAGMIHPNVLKEGKIDAKKYSGFAFGLGLTRLAMLSYGIQDIRLFQSGDLRFLTQF